MGVVHLMAVGLKNWEIGAWDQAIPMFERAQKHPLPAGSPLLVFRDIAGRYLSDYKMLQPMAGSELPKTIEETRSRIVSLKQALNSLQTRGRARFHVRVWQLRLHRHIKELRRQAREQGDSQNKAPRYSLVMPKFRQLVDEAKYAEASELLQDVTMEGHEEEERDSWIYLTDSASAFLGTLEQVIPKAGVKMEIEGVDGEKYQRILSAKAGGLNLQGKEGEVFVAWSKLKPDSVLSIHQKAFRQTLSTLEGQLRTEQAICYAWLTGMKDKAKGAARKLSDTNVNLENVGKAPCVPNMMHHDMNSPKPDDWRNKEALHQPNYPDDSALTVVTESLSSLPPLVFADEVKALREDLAKVEMDRVSFFREEIVRRVLRNSRRRILLILLG